MKTRIAALALAIAFVAAPAFGALARAACPPCAAQPADAGPCTSLAVGPCCGQVTPAATAKAPIDAPTVHAISGSGSAAAVSAYALAPRAAHELAASTSPLRLSVVRRL